MRWISGPTYGFAGPLSMVLDGPDLFVGNGGSSSVDELSAPTAQLGKVMTDAAYQFDGPAAMVLYGSELFVANGLGGSVTELPT